MSEESLVGGKVNVDKYMTLLQSESDLKVKLQQLFLKMKKTESEDKAEIERLQALLSQQPANVGDKTDSLKLSAEINTLKMNLETANSKLNNCRNAYNNLEDDIKTKDRKIADLKRELDNVSLTQTTAKKLHTPAKKTIAQREATLGKDDLTQISGVGPKIQEKMYAEGITQFEQIAAWKAADIRIFDEKLSFKGRIKRDEWVKQAKALMKK